MAILTQTEAAAAAPSRAAIFWAVALNLIPVVGVLIWGWSAFSLILLYWLENVVVGVRTLAGIVVVALRQGSWPFALFLAPFFTVHYGLFCMVHGVFVMSLFGGDAFSGVDANPFDLSQAVGAAFAAQPNLWIAFASIALWQIGSFIWAMIKLDPAEAVLQKLMFEPYPRIVVLHIAILASGLIVVALGQPVWAVAILGALKCAFEVGWLRFGSRLGPKAHPRRRNHPLSRRP